MRAHPRSSTLADCRLTHPAETTHISPLVQVPPFSLSSFLNFWPALIAGDHRAGQRVRCRRTADPEANEATRFCLFVQAGPKAIATGSPRAHGTRAVSREGAQRGLCFQADSGHTQLGRAVTLAWSDLGPPAGEAAGQRKGSGKGVRTPEEQDRAPGGGSLRRGRQVLEAATESTNNGCAIPPALRPGTPSQRPCPSARSIPVCRSQPVGASPLGQVIGRGVSSH